MIRVPAEAEKNIKNAVKKNRRKEETENRNDPIKHSGPASMACPHPPLYRAPSHAVDSPGAEEGRGGADCRLPDHAAPLLAGGCALHPLCEVLQLYTHGEDLYRGGTGSGSPGRIPCGEGTEAGQTYSARDLIFHPEAVLGREDRLAGFPGIGGAPALQILHPGLF